MDNRDKEHGNLDVIENREERRKKGTQPESAHKYHSRNQHGGKADTGGSEKTHAILPSFCVSLSEIDIAEAESSRKHKAVTSDARDKFYVMNNLGDMAESRIDT